MGLTYPQYLVLTVLWEQDGVTVSEIGHRLMLDSGTLTPVIKRLETMELLLRKRSLEDEREVYVYIGPKGIALREEALEARRFVACRLDMTEQEIRDLRGNIMDLIGKLGDDTFRVCKAAE